MTIRLALHADSARERPLEDPKPEMLISASYLPGYIVLTIESSPPRTVVVKAEPLMDALLTLEGKL